MEVSCLHLHVHVFNGVSPGVRTTPILRVAWWSDTRGPPNTRYPSVGVSTRPLLVHDLAWPCPVPLTYGLYTCVMCDFACALGVAGGRDGASPSIAPDDLFGCLESFGVVLPAQDEDIVADALREGPGRY